MFGVVPFDQNGGAELQRSATWKSTLVELLADRGFSLSRCVDSRRVREFIERLHPVAISKQLIRLGDSGDGGYLAPDDLDDIVACFSPGVDKVATFEQAVIARGIPCFLVDGSVSAPPFSNPLIRFDKKFLGVVENDRTVTMDEWVATCAPGAGDLLLQMDIEGAEYPVLLNASEEVLKRFRIIIIELHSLDRLIDPVGFALITSALDRLLKHFRVVHIHPNNNVLPLRGAGLTIPRMLEITFLRRDRVQAMGFARQFPHPLDRRNLPNRPDLVLPAEWYGGPP
jgi:hypothetical protein